MVVQNAAGAAPLAANVSEHQANNTHNLSLAAVCIVSATVSTGIMYIAWRYSKRRMKAAVDKRVQRAIVQKFTAALNATAPAREIFSV